MTKIRELLALLEAFFFQPRGTQSIGLFRIVFSILVLQQLVYGMAPDLFFWYGKNAIVPFDLVRIYSWQGEARFDLLTLLPDDTALLIYFSSVVLSAVFLGLGLFSRFSSAYLAMALISLHHHNPYLANAGDNMMRLMAIFLAFSRCGDSFSLDSKFFPKQKPSNAASEHPATQASKSQIIGCWAERMIQVQMAIAYCGAFWVKAVSPDWYDGTAIYYATRLIDFMHNPFAPLDNLVFCKLLGLTTLLVEAAAWTLIWLQRFRPYVLCLLLILHLSIDYLFNLPVFQGIFIAGLITFIEPSTIAKWKSQIEALARKLSKKQTPVMPELVQSRTDLRNA